MIAIVVAHSANRVIGRDGELPWRLPSDMRRFRELTTPGTVLMGRRTFESLPNAFRPLPERRNLVLSSRRDWRAEGAETFASVEDAFAACDRECFVIGGGVVYAETLALAERVYATEVEGELDGDTLFPELDANEWRELERGEPLSENGQSFRFCVYARVG